MNIRTILATIAAVCLLVSCQKEEGPGYSLSDDAEYLQDGLVSHDRMSEDYRPLAGSFQDGTVTIFVSSYQEAEDHFLSLAPRGARIQRDADRFTWSLTDGEGKSQGDAVFARGDGQRVYATLDLPASCTLVRKVSYESSRYRPFQAVDPAVEELLEDYYYYGAIVTIPDHGCGSGKFVVLREYNFDTASPGMAIRLGDVLTETDENWNCFKRASCLSTLEQARALLDKDWNRISKQLRNAGSSNIRNRQYASSSQQWTGRHYYYNLETGEYDTIGPFNDLQFYEAWIYWFEPSGDHLSFW